MNKVLAPRGISFTESVFEPLSENDATTIDEGKRVQDKFNEVSDELLRCFYLPNNWDGLNAVAPSPKLVRFALTFLCNLKMTHEPIPNDVALSTDGTIVLFWDEGSTSKELEFLSTSKWAWTFIDRNANSSTMETVEKDVEFEL